MKKKLYLVKREVWATSLKRAIETKGKVYEIAETGMEKNEKSKVGFNVPTTPKK